MKQKIFLAVRLLLVPFKLALLIVPAVALIVYVNYTVDCSGLFQGDLTTRTIVDQLLEGSNVSNCSQMDQRAVTELYIQLLPADEVPDTIAVGSSRVMQVTAELAGDSFFNCGVTGASYPDLMSMVYLLEKYEKLPKRLLISVDPWLFRADAVDRRTDLDLYDEMLSVALGHSTAYQAPVLSTRYKLCDRLVARAAKGEASLQTLNITDTTLSALFEPAYFQGNVAYYKTQQASGVATTEDGEAILYHALTDAELVSNEDEVKMADGSIWYSASFRNGDRDAVLQAAAAQTGTFLYMSDYAMLETDMCALFEEFIAYVQSLGIEPVLMLSPYHPFLYEYVSIYDRDAHAGFFEIEPYLRDYAAREGITVIGSYDPSLLGLSETDFFDGLHIRTSGIAKYFGGFDAAGNVLPGSEWDGVTLQPLASAEAAEGEDAIAAE